MSQRKRTAWVLGVEPDPTKPITKYYDLGQQIGQPGQFGYACIATHKATREQRAVKVIKKRPLTEHLDVLRAEITVMQSVKHPNLIELFDVFEDQNNLYIIMTLCKGRELFDRIQERGTYTEQDAAAVLRQIFEGVAYLHDRKIAHCDLKPDNFLFETNDEKSSVKVIDFGMSKFAKSKQYFDQLCGTPYYVAPEVLESRYTIHCDIWSLGVVMFVMLFGYPPFHAEDDAEIFKLVYQGFNPKVKEGYGPWFPASIPCSDAAMDLMGKLMCIDQADRLTAREALEHPWLTGIKASNKPILPKVLSNLSSFKGKNKLKLAVLDFMKTSLSEDELAVLAQTFKSMDTNGDGLISREEMKIALQKAGGNSSNFDSLIQSADIDGDGVLSYHELLLTCVAKRLNAKEERIEQVFMTLDRDGDGQVTRAELEEAMGAEAGSLVAEADVDGDGRINYDEFLAIWRDQEESAAGYSSKLERARSLRDQCF